MSDKLAQVALRTSLLYAFFAGLWIMLSDRVVVALFSDHRIIDDIQTFKGLAFVIVTTLLLYVSLKTQLRLWVKEAVARNKAETELQLFRSLTDRSNDGILVIDPKTGIILDVNETACQQRGHTRDELLGRHVFDLSPVPEDLPWDERVEKIRVDSSQVVERQHKRKDGSVFPVEVSITYVTRNEGDRIISMVRDITERKHSVEEQQKLETQLAQSQKMEAIGQLSGGIAHDFNNILAAIVGNVELAEQDVGPNHPALEWLKGINKATGRAKKLVQQILAFSRQQKQERNIIGLKTVVQESVRLLRAMLPAGVELSLSCSDDTPNVQADPTQVQQVILNLGTNAWQAMEGAAGRITVVLASVDVGEELARSNTDLRPGSYARLSVTDTGKGMDGEVLKRIFEPFFTTKEPGQGTGLGLPVVHGIMKSHQGAVTVVSRPGHGATFCLYFPAVDGTALTTETTKFQLPHGEGQNILYLDDEGPLVLVASKMLQRLGYRVSGFTRPEEALKAFTENPRHFDLVITDLNMPEFSGLDVAAELMKLRPNIPVVLSSGHFTEELKATAAQAGIKNVLHKPTTMKELSEVIHCLVTDRK